MLAQAAVSINGRKVHDPNQQIEPEDGMTIQVGKRKFARVELAKDPAKKQPPS